MPSPPAAVSDSHHSTAVRDGGGVARVDQHAARRPDQLGRGRDEAVGDAEVPQVVAVVVRRALRREHLEGRDGDAVEPVGGPAVAAVRRREGLRIGGAGRASGSAGRRPRSPAPVRPRGPRRRPAARAGRRRRLRRTGRAAGRRPWPTTAGSRRRAAASRSRARPTARRSRRRRAGPPRKQLGGRAIEERAPGPGVGRTRLAVGRAEPLRRDRVVAADEHDGARAHVLLLAHELVHADRAVGREGLVGVLEQRRREDVAAGAIVGGR